MAVYVEFPFDRIVGIHGKRKGPPPPPDDGFPPILRCGTFTYTCSAPALGGLVNIEPDLFLVRNPGNSAYGQRLPGIFLTPNGIVFGYYGVHETALVFMTPTSYKVTVEGGGAAGVGFGIVHMDGPRDYNKYWNSLGVPIGPPFTTIGGNGFEWTYNVNPGNNGMYSPGLTVDWDDPTRWDPNYGGSAWMVVPRDSAYFLGQGLDLGGSMTVTITSTCIDRPGGDYRPPFIATDDGQINPMGGGDAGDLSDLRLPPSVRSWSR